MPAFILGCLTTPACSPPANAQEFALAISGGGYAYTPTPSPVPGVPLVGPNADDDDNGSDDGTEATDAGGEVAGSIIAVGAVLVMAAYCWKQQKDGHDPVSGATLDSVYRRLCPKYR